MRSEKWRVKLLDRLRRFAISPQIVISPIKTDIRLRIKLYKEYGRRKIFKFVYQLEVLLEDKWFVVVRYDNFRGFFHKNLCDNRGKTIKVERFDEFDEVNMKKQMEIAKNDLITNYQTYINSFIERN